MGWSSAGSVSLRQRMLTGLSVLAAVRRKGSVAFRCVHKPWPPRREGLPARLPVVRDLTL